MIPSQKSTNNLYGGAHRKETVARWMRENYQTLREYCTSGLTWAQIAEHYHVHPVTLRYRIAWHAHDLVAIHKDAKKARRLARAPIVAENAKRSKREWIRAYRASQKK